MWYIELQPDGTCQITPAPTGSAQQWGPFSSSQEAIRRRIGLIRAGQCRPQRPEN